MRTFFFETGDWIKMKHSKTLPFCKEHPGTTDKHTRTQGSSQRHLRRRRHQSNTSAPPSPPSASPRDTKTLEMLQKLAPQTTRRIIFVERPSAIPSSREEEEEAVQCHRQSISAESISNRGKDPNKSTNLTYHPENPPSPEMPRRSKSFTMPPPQ
jgi:hypothetical protein